MGSSRSKAKRKADLARRAQQRSARKGLLLNSPVASVEAVKAAELKPKPVANEPLHDMAVFARSSREQLPEEWQTQAAAVAESLELVQQGKDGEALQILKDIPRASPFADWRLFVRGLVAFYAGDLAAAREAWGRLDPDRRPARIAAVLFVAESEVALVPEGQQPAEGLVIAARQLRSRKHILAAAGNIAQGKQQRSMMTFSVLQAKQLLAFRDDFRGQDPEFVNRFAQACVRLAAAQAHKEVFDLLVAKVPGPTHDPHWNLQRFNFALQFEGAHQQTQTAASNYLKDLEQCSLPLPVKQALASMLRMAQANYLLMQAQHKLGLYGCLFGDRINYNEIEHWLREALTLYPANRNAHLQLLDVLKQQMDDEELATPDKKKIERRLVAAHADFVKAFPSEVDATLWLIDHYLDENQLAEASVLIGQLSSYRLEDPRAKILPWKLKLRTAMVASRSKAKLPEVIEYLAEAEGLWPTWVSRDWLAFLRAAVALRGGDRATFDQLDAQARAACGAPPLLADCMTFAAAQQMNVPTAALKPLRETVERHLARVHEIPLTDLFALGNFWWDMVRTGLRHKAYRLQAAKIGKGLVKRLKGRTEVNLHSPDLEGACCWMAEHRFWSTAYEVKVPARLHEFLDSSPRFASRVLSVMFRQVNRGQQLASNLFRVEQLQAALKLEKDPYYRYTMNAIMEYAQGLIDEAKSIKESHRLAGLGEFLNADEDDDDDDDDYYDDDEIESDEYSDAVGDEWFDEPLDAVDGLSPDEIEATIVAMPLIVQKVFSRLEQRGGIDQLLALMKELGLSINNRASSQRVTSKIQVLFQSNGLSSDEADEFVTAFFELAIKQAHSSLGSRLPAAPTQTAEDRRRSRKERQKELAKKRKG